MTARIAIEPTVMPYLAPHMRLRFDGARQIWTIQSPERVFILDGPAHAVISRLDGSLSVTDIVTALCDKFVDAPRDVIEKDVVTLLQDFADKGVVSI
jgi:pyrroloquinoline quinone biosynthesis protein D